MGNADNEDDVARKSLRAYRVFQEETLAQISRVEHILNKTSELREESSEFKEMRMVFHRIRGGAGFFKLKEVEKLAAKLEACFSVNCPEGKVHKREVLPLLSSLNDQMLLLTKGPEAID